MKVEQEDHTENVKIMEGKHEELTIKVEELERDLQRNCEEIEVLQLIIEEKENMDIWICISLRKSFRQSNDFQAVDSKHLNAVSDDEEKPVGQQYFVQQLTKEAAPRAFEQKVSEEDDEQRHSLINVQLTRLSKHTPLDKLISLSKDELSILYEKWCKLEEGWFEKWEILSM